MNPRKTKEDQLTEINRSIARGYQAFQNALKTPYQIDVTEDVWVDDLSEFANSYSPQIKQTRTVTENRHIELHRLKPTDLNHLILTTKNANIDQDDKENILTRILVSGHILNELPKTNDSEIYWKKTQYTISSLCKVNELPKETYNAAMNAIINRMAALILKENTPNEHTTWNHINTTKGDISKYLPANYVSVVVRQQVFKEHLQASMNNGSISLQNKLNEKYPNSFPKVEKTLTWAAVHAEFSAAFKRAENSERDEFSEMQKILRKIQNSSDTDANKITKFKEEVYLQYRSILRTGKGIGNLNFGDTTSRLATEVQKSFHQAFNINLPKKLSKGEGLTLESILPETQSNNTMNYKK